MQVSLTLRRHRPRITLRSRLRGYWLGWLRKRYARALKAADALDAAEIERVRCTVDRLEIAARIGSSSAARKLADIGADTIGQERRRLASEALDRLRALNVQFKY